MFCKNLHVDHSLTTFDDLDDDELREIVLVAFWYPNARVWTLYGYLKETFMAHLENEERSRTDRVRCMAPLLSGHGNMYEFYEDSVDFMMYLDGIGLPQAEDVVTIHRHLWYDAETDTYTPEPGESDPLPIQITDNRILATDKLDVTPLEGDICTVHGKGWTKHRLGERLQVFGADYSKRELCGMLSRTLSKMSEDDRHVISMRRVANVDAE